MKAGNGGKGNQKFKQQKSTFKYIGKTGMNTNWNVSIIFHGNFVFCFCVTEHFKDSHKDFKK